MTLVGAATILKLRLTSSSRGHDHNLDDGHLPPTVPVSNQLDMSHDPSKLSGGIFVGTSTPSSPPPPSDSEVGRIDNSTQFSGSISYDQDNLIHGLKYLGTVLPIRVADIEVQEIKIDEQLGDGAARLPQSIDVALPSLDRDEIIVCDVDSIAVGVEFDPAEPTLTAV